MLSVFRPHARILALAAFTVLLAFNLQASPNFSTPQVFAQGGNAFVGTSPDSIFYGGGSVWVAF